MKLNLRPETLRLIDDEMRAGGFATREEFIDAAITKMRDRDRAKADITANAAINAAGAERDRGGCGQHPRVAEAD